MSWSSHSWRLAGGLLVMLFIAFTVNAQAQSPDFFVYIPIISKPPAATTPTATVEPTTTAGPTTTVEPTTTLVPTATITPTTTPTPGTGISILSNQSTYVDSIGNLHIFGEVSNNTDETPRLIKVTGKILDAGGQELTEDFTYVWLDTLKPGERACFDLSLPEPAGWASYQFEPLTYLSGGSPAPELAIQNATEEYESGPKIYTVRGQVQNTTSQTLNDIQVIGTIYNSAGAVIGCFFDTVGTMEAGATADFEIRYVGEIYNQAGNSYRLQTDGRTPAYKKLK